MTARRFPRRSLLLFPVVLAFLVMVPRWLSPTFGLLDDGVTLRAATQIGRQWDVVLSFYSDTGRFMPAYWLSYFLVHRVVGPSALGFFVVNAIVLACAALGVATYVRRTGGTTLQALAASLFLVLSLPAVETFYTLSKAEVPQLLWLVTSLVLVSAYPAARAWWNNALTGLGMFLALLLADITKETGLAMVPIAVAWLVLTWWRRTEPACVPMLMARAVYAVAAIAAGASFFVLRGSALGLRVTGGWYARAYDISVTNVSRSLADWAALLARDFAYLVPLVAFAVARAIAGRRRPRALVLEALVWTAGWMAVYLPWGWTFDYYLLPFTIGCAMLGGVLLSDVLAAASACGRPVRVAGMVTLGIVGALWVLNLLTLVSNGAVQIAVDAANSDMVAFLATVPRDSSVIVNFTGENEYIDELRLHLGDVKGRPDIAVGYWKIGDARPSPLGPTYLVTPHLKRQLHPTVRLAFSERAVEHWNGRLRQLGRDKLDLVYETRRHVRLLDVGLYRLLCPLIGGWHSPGTLCKTERPIVDTRVFSYGWAVYHLSPAEG